MLLDFLDKLTASGGVAVTSSDAYTDYSKDLGNVTPKRQVGTGTRLSLMFVVKTAGSAVSATDTSDFIAVQSVNANLTSHDEIIKRRIPQASMRVGAIIEVPIPVATPTKRYLGGRVELGTGDTVTVDCYLIPSDHIQAFLAYAKGFAV